jgi:hypothetical protein
MDTHHSPLPRHGDVPGRFDWYEASHPGKIDQKAGRDCVRECLVSGADSRPPRAARWRTMIANPSRIVRPPDAILLLKGNRCTGRFWGTGSLERVCW